MLHNSGQFTSERLTQLWQDPEYKERMLTARRKPWTQERLQAHSERMKGNQHTKGRQLNPEHRDKLQASLYGNKRRLGIQHTAESKALMSKARKGVPKTPTHAANLIKHLANIHSPTSIEIILGRKLSLEYPGEEIIPEYPFGFFLYDFAIPNLKLFFEADGEYWHSFPNAKKRDKSKTTYATKRGWALQRFTGTELHQWDKENQ